MITSQLNQWKYTDNTMNTKRTLVECIFYLPMIIHLLIPNKEFIGIKRDITVSLLHTLTPEEVKKLYFKVVRILHPDKIPGIYIMIMSMLCVYM